MELDFWASTDVGRVRERNEDNFLVDPTLQLFVVCDGMGGHAAGDVASSMCVRIVRDYLIRHEDVIEAFDADPLETVRQESVIRLIEEAVKVANAEVFQHAEQEVQRKGMGTTCSLLLIRANQGFIAHVGDSRVYLYRDGTAHQMTEDHSLAAEMVRLGKIEPEDVSKFAKRNAVTRAVGVRKSVEVATYHFEIFVEDLFLLCSDGLSSYFFEGEQGKISRIVAEKDLEHATDVAIQFANDQGGSDNITCVLVRIDSLGETIEPDFRVAIDALRLTPFFSKCTDEELLDIIHVSRRFDMPKDTLIEDWAFEKSQLFIVLEGSLTLKNYYSHQTKVAHPDTLDVGDFFGSTALFGVQQTKVEVCANAPTVLLGIGTQAFESLLYEKPSIGSKVLWPLAKVAVEIAAQFTYKTTIQSHRSPQEMVSRKRKRVYTSDVDIDFTSVRKRPASEESVNVPQDSSPSDESHLISVNETDAFEEFVDAELYKHLRHEDEDHDDLFDDFEIQENTALVDTWSDSSQTTTTNQRTIHPHQTYLDESFSDPEQYVDGEYLNEFPQEEFSEGHLEHATIDFDCDSKTDQNRLPAALSGKNDSKATIDDFRRIGGEPTQPPTPIIQNQLERSGHEQHSTGTHDYSSGSFESSGFEHVPATHETSFYRSHIQEEYDGREKVDPLEFPAIDLSSEKKHIEKRQPIPPLPSIKSSGSSGSRRTQTLPSLGQTAPTNARPVAPKINAPKLEVPPPFKRFSEPEEEEENEASKDEEDFFEPNHEVSEVDAVKKRAPSVTRPIDVSDVEPYSP